VRQDIHYPLLDYFGNRKGRFEVISKSEITSKILVSRKSWLKKSKISFAVVKIHANMTASLHGTQEECERGKSHILPLIHNASNHR
jgi:hypothetical protein